VRGSLNTGGVTAEQWALCVALPFGQVSNMALFVVLALVRQDLALSYSELGLMLASFGVARVVTDLPAGALLRRVNPRTALLVALAGTLVAAIVGLTAASAWQVGASRFIHGVMSSVTQCAVLAWLVGGAGSGTRGRVMALSEAVFSVAGLITPVAVGSLAALLSWRAAFVLGILASLIALAAAAFWTDAASAKAALGVKGADEMEAPRRLLERWSSLRQAGRVLASVYLITFIIYFGRQSVIGTLLPLVGGEHIGLSSLEVGLGLTILNLVSIGAVMLGGWAGDRFGQARMVVPGVAVLLACQLSVLLAHNEPAFLFFAVMAGLSFFMNSLPLSLVGDALPPQLRADGVAVFRLIADVGVLLAPTAMGFALDAGGFTAAELVPPAVTFAILAAVIVLRPADRRAIITAWPSR
jgi:DHA1 family multidrug resistance protein-like MFS transporter